MNTVTFKAPDMLCDRLEALARKLDRQKSYLLRKALESFLEDEEDYMIAMERMAKDEPSKRIPFEQIKRKYGLDH